MRYVKEMAKNMSQQTPTMEWSPRCRLLSRTEFRQSLDGKMRVLKLEQRRKRNYSEAPRKGTEEEEELLWTKGNLGGATPDSCCWIQ